MAFTNGGTSVCRHCRHYSLTGRRGGECLQLAVPVKAEWSSCSLAQPPFKPTLPATLPVAEVLGEAVSSAMAEPVQRTIAPASSPVTFKRRRTQLPAGSSAIST